MQIAKRFSVIAGVLAAVICSSAVEAAAQSQPILGCCDARHGAVANPSRQ